MKKNIILSFFVLLFSLSAKAQYKQLTPNDHEYGLMLAVINEWCDQYFNDCFGWQFVELIQGAEVTRIKSGKWKVNGSNKNQGVASGGRGSETYVREYNATVEEISTSKYRVTIKKQSITILGESWPECTRIIEL